MFCISINTKKRKEKKLDLKNETGVNTFKLAAKSNQARLKAEVDKINIDKLKTVSIDLSKFSNIVKNEKTVYEDLF